MSNPVEARMRDYEKRVKRWTKIRVRSGLVFALMVILLGKPEFWAPGLIVVLIGIFLRVWASGYLLKNKFLCQEGPYCLTQHPLYFGSFISGLGLVFLVKTTWLLIVYILFFGMVYYYSIKIEEERLKLIFNSTYTDYAQRVWRFFPNPLDLGKFTVKGWDFRLFIKNKEYRNISGFLIVVLVLLIKSTFFKDFLNQGG